MAMDERSQARALALQALCIFDALGDDFRLQLDGFLTDPTNHADLDWPDPPTPRVIGLARTLAAGAWEIRTRSDELLVAHAAGWPIDRMQPVDRSILRLGVFELLQRSEVPPAVAISEALVLAARFGGNESTAFVNGVLDAVRRAMLPGDAAKPTDNE
jgi:N utilization substance protein B